MSDPYWSQHPLAAPPRRRRVNKSTAFAVLYVVGIVAVPGIALATFWAGSYRHEDTAAVIVGNAPYATAVAVAPHAAPPVTPRTARQWTTLAVQAVCTTSGQWDAFAIVRNDGTGTRSATFTYTVRAQGRTIATVHGGVAAATAGSERSLRLVSMQRCDAAVTPTGTAYGFAVGATT